MDNEEELEVRQTMMKQKHELLDQSIKYWEAIEKKIDEINIDISVLQAKDEVDHTALQALQETRRRLGAESRKQLYRIVELQEDFNQEVNEYVAYAAKSRARRSNPPAFEEIGVTEGDSF